MERVCCSQVWGQGLVWFCVFSLGVRNANLPYMAPTAGLCVQKRNVKEIDSLQAEAAC